MGIHKELPPALPGSREWIGNWKKEWQHAVQARQRELRSLDDGQLTELDKEIGCSAQAIFARERSQRLLREAIRSEVKRRAVAAGWFWRRWRHPGESAKWQAHWRETEEMIRNAVAQYVGSVSRWSGGKED